MRVLAVLVLLAAPMLANTAVVVRAIESPSDVVFQLEAGSSLLVDPSALDRTAPLTGIGGVNPASGELIFFPGPTQSPGIAVDYYANLTIDGPIQLGTGRTTAATEATGGVFILLQFAVPGGVVQELVLPAGYQSGTLLEPATMVFQDASFASLGIEPGIYEWTVESGRSPGELLIDSIRLIAIPIPAAGWLLSSALGLLCWLNRKSRSAAVVELP